MKHSLEYLMRCIPARAGALLETDKWTIWLNNSCWWKPLWVFNYACSPQSQLPPLSRLCPPRLSSPPLLPSRQTAQSLADTRGKNISLEKKLVQIMRKDLATWNDNFFCWLMKRIQVNQWVLFAVVSLPSVEKQRIVKLFKILNLIKRNYAMIVIVVKSN